MLQQYTRFIGTYHQVYDKVEDDSRNKQMNTECRRMERRLVY